MTNAHPKLVRRLFYLAGPMSGMPNGNFPAFKEAASHLRKRGYLVVSPVELNEVDGETVALEVVDARRAEYMLRDIAIVARPDVEAVVVLPGWEASTGAQAEVAFARSIGKEVLTYEKFAPVLPGRDIHPASARFHEILRDVAAMHDKKQKDYGSATDPFANVRGTSDWGIAAWQGAMIRATDKIKRLQSFARTGRLENEGVVDSFMDLAVYAIIARVLYEQDVSAD